MSHLQDSSVIDRLGGTGAVAQLCEVSSQAVSKWRRTGIPRAQRKYLQAIKPEAFTAPDLDATPVRQVA